LLPAFDARMGELYWGIYQVDEQGVARPVGGEQVAPPERVALPEGDGWVGVGHGWEAHGEALRARLGAALTDAVPHRLCRARDLAVLAADAWGRGEAVAAFDALPVYLRDQVAWKKAAP
jgi:tRNA threonylcarbamoyladenosine biosynthesis protein TsaB